MRVSISKIKMFKGCRRQYELHYLEGLTPVQTSDALMTGRKYHELVAALNAGESIDEDFSKETAMARAYEKYILPNIKVKAVEEPYTLSLDGLADGDELYGIVDGIAEDGCIVEHKTVGKSIDEGYEYDLQWDEQMLAYMLLTGSRDIYYTVCQKPTIRQKKDESEEEFYQRMVAWYDTDTDSKIRLLKLHRTDEEVEQFRKNLLSIVLQMRIAQSSRDMQSQSVTDPFYRNQGYCNMWGRRCEYASVCLHYDPEQEYMEFTKKEVE